MKFKVKLIFIKNKQHCLLQWCGNGVIWYLGWSRYCFYRPKPGLTEYRQHYKPTTVHIMGIWATWNFAFTWAIISRCYVFEINVLLPPGRRGFKVTKMKKMFLPSMSLTPSLERCKKRKGPCRLFLEGIPFFLVSLETLNIHPELSSPYKATTSHTK